jgi:hypothetical protein
VHVSTNRISCFDAVARQNKGHITRGLNKSAPQSLSKDTVPDRRVDNLYQAKLAPINYPMPPPGCERGMILNALLA